MPKENKSTNWRNRRHSLEVDNIKHDVTSERGSTIGNKRYSPFQRELLRGDLRVEKQNVKMTSSEVLHSISGGIIESGIKYIMFPLHLLRFCLFGISSVSEKLTAPEKDQEPKDSGTNNKKEMKNVKTSDRKSSTESRRYSESGVYSKTKNELPGEKDSKNIHKSDNEVFIDALSTIENDSDSSVDQWSSASSTMITNMSIDNDGIDRSISFAPLEEPMDISMEEHIYEKFHIVTKSTQDNCTIGSTLNNAPRSYVKEESSYVSVDEIARIFQKQCTSSDDENPSSYSKTSSSKRDKTRESNFLCHKKGNDSIAASESEKPQKVDKERKKKTSVVIVNHKRRKVSHDDDKSEKQKDHKNEGKLKPREGKHSSKQDSSSKSKTKSSKSPVKTKESKRRENVKYKETATQTDSAFSDDDIEMLPVDAKLAEKRFCCKHMTSRSHPNLYQNREMDLELNYVADNEDSNEGDTRIARKRISSCSTSSSSTDLGFDEYVIGIPDGNIGVGRWNENTADTFNTFRMCSRAPPGFPELPQNPPLLVYNPIINQTSGMVPRAPSPMRHLYYDYPEFMDLPTTVKSSKMLNNIISNNYR